MPKKVVIDTDESVLAHIVCRRLNNFKMSITFKNSAGVVTDISTDSFSMEVTNQSGSVILAFSSGNGVTISGNKLTLSKPATLMTLPVGEYNFGLLQTKVGDITKTRLNGTFEVKDKIKE
jgi:hypothetical protein